jgi:hypothetical protein
MSCVSQIVRIVGRQSSKRSDTEVVFINNDLKLVLMGQSIC